MMDAHWSVKPFAALSVHELHDLLRLRVDVFVVEQNCPYPELDGQDREALHVMLHTTSNELIAYARILPPHGDGPPHIGRVVVRENARGGGIASHLMEKALEVINDQYGSRRSALAAQAHLERFYARHGFVRIREDYLLDGIPHVDMRRDEA
jgi:ElaA protein